MTYFIFGILASGLLGYGICLWSYWEDIYREKMIDWEIPVKNYNPEKNIIKNYVTEFCHDEINPCPWCGKVPKPQISGSYGKIYICFYCCSKQLCKRKSDGTIFDFHHNGVMATDEYFIFKEGRNEIITICDRMPFYRLFEIIKEKPMHNFKVGDRVYCYNTNLMNIAIRHIGIVECIDKCLLTIRTDSSRMIANYKQCRKLKKMERRRLWIKSEQPINSIYGLDFEHLSSVEKEGYVEFVEVMKK